MNQKSNTDKYQRLQVAILNIHNKTFPIYEGVNTIGRNKEAIVNIKHLNVSQHHAIIVITNGNHFISDLNSSNGTFLENHKIEPFKLSILQNDTNIKLGELHGTYILQGPFFEHDQNQLEMTQNVTQSFYGSNTQILDTDNGIEDIHEAPTQEISWAAFKIPKSVKTLENKTRQIITQRADVTNLSNNAENDEEEEDIHTCETQVISDSIAATKINKGDGQIDCSKTAGENIHDAQTQSLPISSENSHNINDPTPETEIFGPFNDEDLPLLENNDNYVEIHTIPDVDKTLDIHEAVTQVINICKKDGQSTHFEENTVEVDNIKGDLVDSREKHSQNSDDEATQVADISKKEALPNSNLEDDEATDCEDIEDDEVDKTKANLMGFKKKHSDNTSLDEATDCEDNTKEQQEDRLLASDNDSNESMEFFKLDRSVNNDSKESIDKSGVAGSDTSLSKNKNKKTESSSDEIIGYKKKKVCRVSSDSESDDDEKIGLRRKRKSSMILYSEDICGKESNRKSVRSDSDQPKELRNQDSYLIDETDSETEIESTKKNYLEETIPPTQNQTANDLDDTDCIPATQEVIKSLPNKSTVCSQNNFDSGLSEESFKLGLTETMTNLSQPTDNGKISQDPCCSKSLKNPSPVFGEPINNTQSDDTDKTDIYDSSMLQNKNAEIKNDDKDKTSTSYFAPTQKLTVAEKLNSGQEKLILNFNITEDLYEEPTQITDTKKSKHPIGGNTQLDATNDDFYFAPTQKAFSSENVYEAVTQKIDAKKTKRGSNKGQLDDTHTDIYFAPTQKTFSSENVYEAVTQKVDVKKTKREGQLDDTNTDIYFAPTQKVSNKISDQNSPIEESMDELYLQQTQQEDVFDQPTQKITKFDREIEDCANQQFTKPNSVVDTPRNAQSKKKFSFKKQAFNLDGSLTSILGHTPQPFVQREDRSSIELELIQSVNVPADTSKRPSNPLSYTLENAGDLDPEEKRKPTGITNKSPEEDNDGEESDKTLVAVDEDRNLKRKREIKGKEVIEENRATAASDMSSKDLIPASVGASTRSLRTKQASSSSFQGNEENKKPMDKSDNKPIERRNKRRLTSVNSDSDTLENKLEVSSDLNDNSPIAGNTEVNQSIALLESKTTRTRKTGRSSAKVQVKVPKHRKSMTISDAPKDIINNNIPSKFDQESNKDNIKSGSKLNTTTTTTTTTKRGRSKRKQFEEGEIQDRKTANKSLKGDKGVTTICNKLDRTTRNNPKIETINVTSKAVEDTSTASTSNVRSSSTKARQVSKRKQLLENKSDNSDASMQSIDSNLTTPKKQKAQPTRQVGKRKELSDNSDLSMQSVDSNLVTPKKQKIQANEALLNTKERGLRKQRPKVVFTMLESPQLESLIKQLGGSVIDSVDACTVLLTEHVKRSQKLLSVVGLGKPICSPKWVTDSKKSHEFLDPWDYILTDPEAEKKWDFSLKESLNRSKAQKLLGSYHFQIMVSNAADVLKGAIESCGGKCISKIPSKPLDNTYIISTPENQSKYRRIIKQHSSIKVIEPEAIFDGVLRQQLRFTKHYLS